LISQSGTKRNVISPVPDKGGTDRTDITGTKRTEMDCVASLKWHRSNRNAWHYNTEMGGTKRTEVSIQKQNHKTDVFEHFFHFQFSGYQQLHFKIS